MSSHKSGSCATLVVQGLGLNITQKYDCNMAFDLSEGKYNIYVGNTREYSEDTFFYVRCLDGMGYCPGFSGLLTLLKDIILKTSHCRIFWLNFTLRFSSTDFVCGWNRVELCVSDLELGFQCTIEHQFSSWLEANHDFCAKALLSTINYSSLCWHVIGRAASGGGLPLVEEAKFKVAAAAVQWRKAHQRYILLANLN